MTQTAHQYLIRKEKEKSEIIGFNPLHCDLKNTEIKIIDRKTATDLIIEYEWLKSMPLVVKYCFGIYFKINNKQYLGGVLVFSDDYAQNTGVWDKYGFQDKLILLSRGVCLWWTPKNTASYFISKTYKWFKENTKYRIMTATTDPQAGEIGTIYQSLNWDYVGLMTGNYSGNKETKRFSVLINGKLRYSRSIRKELGSMKKSEILKKYPDAKFIPQYRKRRYFYFFDTKTNNKILKSKIKHLFLQYPKRNVTCFGLIYKIRNKINNKIYIGQTIRSFDDRIDDYKRGLGNIHLNNSFKKYGFENFDFTIIDTATSIDELNDKEIKYIELYDSRNSSIGYNIELGGRNSITSDETKSRISKANKGRKQTDEWINKRIPSKGSNEAKKYGRSKTDDEKQYLSDNSPKYWLGKQRSENTKIKISKTKKKNGLSDKQKKILCKKVASFNPQTNKIIEVFNSTVDASKYYNISQSTISRRCSGKSNNKGSIFFKYLVEED